MPRGGGGSRSRASPTQHAEKLAEKEGGASLMNINLMDVVELASTGSLDSTSLLSHGSAEKPAVDFMDKYRLEGAGEAAVAKGRGRASTGDANADTALRIRNEDIQYNQDSFEAIALRMESEQTDEGGAEAPTVY